MQCCCSPSCIIFHLEQLTAQGPAPLGVLFIVSPPWEVARVDYTPALLHRHSLAAVFEIHCTPAFEPLPHGRQHGGRRTLFGALEDVEHSHDVSCVIPGQDLAQSAAGRLQTCSDAARVDGETPHAGLPRGRLWNAMASRDLGGHVYICQLALRIAGRWRVGPGFGEVDVVEVDVGIAMRRAAECNDARLEGHRRRGLERREEEMREEEVCQVVDTEMALEAVFGPGKRDVPDAGVGDEDVEPARPGEEGRRARADRGQGVEVQFEEMDLGITGEELRSQRFAGLGQVPRREVECRAGLCESAGGLDAQSARAACDQDDEATEIGEAIIVFDDL